MSDAEWYVPVLGTTNMFQHVRTMHLEGERQLRFEYLDQDLKKLLDMCDGGLDPATTKAAGFGFLEPAKFAKINPSVSPVSPS